MASRSWLEMYRYTYCDFTQNPLRMDIVNMHPLFRHIGWQVCYHN